MKRLNIQLILGNFYFLGLTENGSNTDLQNKKISGIDIDLDMHIETFSYIVNLDLFLFKTPKNPINLPTNGIFLSTWSQDKGSR